MILPFIKQYFKYQFFILVCCICLCSCKRPAPKEYSYNAKGYYYKLISFTNDTVYYQPGYMARLAVAFSTQADSVFWDSHNNINDNFFMQVDSLGTDNFLKHYSSKCFVGDSACMLIKPADFFKQQFKADQVPFFSKKDSVVKVHFKVKEILSPDQFAAVNQNLYKKEQQQIDAFIKANPGATEDAMGVYWIEKPKEINVQSYPPGSVITLSYRATYLNGRFLEASPPRFEYITGTPDQLLKGLNYVIGKIKIGQNAKIILPSRLAFGENGSANGIVAPYTPLLYEIKIIDVKNNPA